MFLNIPEVNIKYSNFFCNIDLIIKPHFIFKHSLSNFLEKETNERPNDFTFSFNIDSLTFVLIAVCIYFWFFKLHIHILISVVLSILDAAYEVIPQFV